MRLVLALAIGFHVFASSSAFASLDDYTRYLHGQPMTRLDALVLSARKASEKIYADHRASNLKFAYLLDELKLHDEKTDAEFSFASNSLLMQIRALKDRAPTPEDCASLLDAYREMLVFSHLSTSKTDDQARQQGATTLMGFLLLTPSTVDNAGAPEDLRQHMAALTKVSATLETFVNGYTSVSCSGSLSGVNRLAMLTPDRRPTLTPLLPLARTLQ